MRIFKSESAFKYNIILSRTFNTLALIRMMDNFCEIFSIFRTKCFLYILQFRVTISPDLEEESF